MGTFLNRMENAGEPLNDFLPHVFDRHEEHYADKYRPVDFSLNFDGSKLELLADGETMDYWPAVSGLEGHWDKKYQKERDVGPIPEGNYSIEQQKFQNRLDEPLYKRTLSYWPERKLTKFPGGEIKWGDSRIEPVPMEGTDTYGRDGFFIHGGNRHASAGCIDLARYNDDFMNLFRQLGKDLPLSVRYPEKMENFDEIRRTSNKKETPETYLSKFARWAGND